MQIQIGLQGFAEAYVTKEDTAKEVGSGDLLVYATPSMIAMMEDAAYESLLPFLDEGQSSVGVRMDVTHEAATPVGMDVHAESVVTAVEGKKVTFQITAYDESGVIGHATHERVIINAQRFLDKVYAKL